MIFEDIPGVALEKAGCLAQDAGCGNTGHGTIARRYEYGKSSTRIMT